MNKPKPVKLETEYEKLTCLKNRTPYSTAEEKKDAFANIGAFGDGAIFLGRFAGSSDWERHASGDEIVYIIKGSTSFFLLLDGEEHTYSLSEGELVVVPKGAWHRFESHGEIVVMTATPQPTDHSEEHPTQ